MVDRAPVNRRGAARAFLAAGAMVGGGSEALAASGRGSRACGDIETCRELGERKVEEDMRANPTYKLDRGVRYKILKPGREGVETAVTREDSVDIIYSISAAGGAYFYSKGFGFEKSQDEGFASMNDAQAGESYRVRFGGKDVPVGIEDAIVGMKRGERRRVELPPAAGLATSDWNPAPTSRRGKAQIKGYRQILDGTGGSPPFAAEVRNGVSRQDWRPW
jgi:hypothetical protein